MRELRRLMAQTGHLSTYLNDHLAGSTVAIELLARVEHAYQGNEIGQFSRQLREDIMADREELRRIMQGLKIAESRPRMAIAWLSEKLTEAKLLVEAGLRTPLYLLEALDALAVGIHGKYALWTALAAVAEKTPALQGVDYNRLMQRADDQRRRVEGVRLAAAREALGLAA